ncbi:MAG: CPBP family intramembrane metalloprotease [Clostridia bacterium]|nr:CPBP family intramembrane metalloprotease [Clostridia bacterium]
MDHPVFPDGGPVSPAPSPAFSSVPPQGAVFGAPQPVPSPEAEAKRAYSRVGIAFFALVAVSQFALALPVALLLFFFPSLGSEAWFNVLYSFIALYCVGLPVVLLCLIGAPKNEIVRRPFSFGGFVKIAVISLSVMNLLSFFSQWFVGLLENLLGTEISSPLDSSLETSGVWLYLLSAVVIAPVFEELLFRRILLTRLVRFGEWPAVLVGALIFSLVHGNFFQIFYAFAVGVLLGWLYLRTGKLLYPILLHFTVNFFGSVPGILLERFTDTEALEAFFEDPSAFSAEAFSALLPTLAAYGAYLIALGAVMICGLVFLLLSFRRERLRLSLSPFPAKKTAKLALVNVGMILFLILSAVVILVSLAEGALLS